MIKIYVPPPRDHGASGEPGEAPPAIPRYVLPVIPEVALQRHGARVLLPDTAAVVKGQPVPDPTIYRAGVLLMPPRVFQPEALPLLSGQLAEVGMALVSPDDYLLEGPPIAVALAPSGSFLPQGIDAWTALQRLRAGVVDLRAAAQRRVDAAEQSRDAAEQSAAAAEMERVEWLEVIVSEITLEHLLVGSALDGAGAGLIGTNTASNGSPDLGDLFDRPPTGTSGRIPVTVVLDTPGRPEVGPGARRRPIVAVLDTGIAANPMHPWLEYVERGAAGERDAVVIVNSPLQQEIEQSALGGAGLPRTPIRGFVDTPFIEEPLRGDLSTHAGHGTFIAGIIRQLAPGAQIYTVRVMHPDGFAHEADLVLALRRIVEGVETGSQQVDIVSLSLGYFHESAAEEAVTGELEPLLRRLTEAGVAVIAAAGNFSTSREFYPAALTARINDVNAAPMISVGSLNPNGYTSRFSNEAPWVTCYASGAAVVSTFPDFAGAQNAAARIGRRESFDPDDFQSMFGVWSGSSFAAPGLAGCIAEVLCADAGAYDDDPVARAQQARRAWDTVQNTAKYAPPRLEQP